MSDNKCEQRKDLLLKMIIKNQSKILWKPLTHYGNLAIITLFKDSMIWHGHHIDQVSRFFTQIKQQSIDIKPDIYIIVGQSKDHTTKEVISHASKMNNVTVVEEFISNEEVCSTIKRLPTLVIIWHLIFDLIKNKAKEYFWIESDLIIQPDCLIRLFEGRQSGFDIVAPIPLHKNNDTFHDTWGFTNLNLSNWGIKSHHEKFLNRFHPMATIGSCALINGNIINQGIKFGNNCFRGLCENARIAGYKICCDTSTIIYHPDFVVNGRGI